MEQLRQHLNATKSAVQKRDTMIVTLKEELSDRELMLKKISEAQAKLAAESMAHFVPSSRPKDENQFQMNGMEAHHNDQQEERTETAASLFLHLVKEWSMRSVPAGSFQDLLGILQDQEVVRSPLYYSTSGMKGDLNGVMSDVRAFYSSKRQEVDQVLRYCVEEMAKNLARRFGDAMRITRSPGNPTSGARAGILRRNSRRRSRRASDSLVRFTSHYVAGRAIDDALRRLSVDDGPPPPEDSALSDTASSKVKKGRGDGVSS